MDIPMRFEGAALGEAQIGIHLAAHSHLSLDGRGKLAELGLRSLCTYRIAVRQ